MTRKIFKSGNSVVVSLPKETLEVLHLAEGDEVFVQLDPQQRKVIISPMASALSGVDEEFAKQVTDFIEQYRPALEALAK